MGEGMTRVAMEGKLLIKEGSRQSPRGDEERRRGNIGEIIFEGVDCLPTYREK